MNEITRKEAVGFMQDHFNQKLSRRMTAGENVTFRMDGEVLIVEDTDNETMWKIGPSGYVSHRGIGAGCFWTDWEHWFNPATKISKEAMKAIMREIPAEKRRDVKAGGHIIVTITRKKHLHRWGNMAEIEIDRDRNIYQNNLKDNAWNYSPAEAWLEAAEAVDYMVHGDKYERTIL